MEGSGSVDWRDEFVGAKESGRVLSEGSLEYGDQERDRKVKMKCRRVTEPRV